MNRMQRDANGNAPKELMMARVFLDVINQNIKDYLDSAALNPEEIKEFKRLFIDETTSVFNEVAINTVLEEEFNKEEFNSAI